MKSWLSPCLQLIANNLKTLGKYSLLANFYHVTVNIFPQLKSPHEEIINSNNHGKDFS